MGGGVVVVSVGSIQTIDHKLNDLVYTVTVVTKQGTQKGNASFRGLGRFIVAVLTRSPSVKRSASLHILLAETDQCCPHTNEQQTT